MNVNGCSGFDGFVSANQIYALSELVFLEKLTEIESGIIG